MTQTPSISIRRAAERGQADHGWLRSAHTFSFADYHDRAHMGFRNLRVINEDRVAPGKGFGTHPHADMEIVSYVLDGALEHRDSLGNGSVIRPGEVQRMSAGTGVRHSEFNASKSEPVHFLQIWILPERRGIAPGYEQKLFEPESRRDRLRTIVDREGKDGALRIHADVGIASALLGPDVALEHALPPERHAWLQVARGRVGLMVAGREEQLEAGDGVALSGVEQLALRGGPDGSELLLFDLP